MLLPLTAAAQALPFVAADFSAASAGKAGTSAVETSSIAFSSFGNIAAVPYSEKTAEVAAGYALWQPSTVQTNVIAAGGAYNLSGKFGFSFAMTYGTYRPYEKFDDSGFSAGTFSPSDIQVKAGAAWRFLSCLSAGVSVGYASSSLAENMSYGAFEADMFVMAKFNDLKAAFGVTDLGSAVLSASGAKFSLPSAFTLGLGYEKVFADMHKVDIALDADYYFAGALAASVGAEYTFDDMLSFCAGYRYGGNSIIPSYASVGLGGHFFGVSLNMAYVLPIADSPMSNTLSLAVGYSF
jgi:hypothetical protein